MPNRIDDKQKIGIGGFTAYAAVRHVVNKSLDAPDTPLEDGSFANDHLIKKPVILEVSGLVSDVFIRSAVEATIFRRGLSEIGNISKYLPAQTQTQIAKAASIAIDANNVSKGIQAAISDGKQLLDFIGNKSAGQNNRELFIAALDLYYDNSTVMRIEMPDKIYENMVITSRVIEYDNQKDKAISFKLTAKELVFSNVIFSDITAFFKKPAPGDIANQVAGQESNGLNNAPEVPVSLISNIVELF